MSFRRVLPALIVTVLGAFALVEPEPAGAAGAFDDCPISFCVSVCPENPEEYCYNHGCYGPASNCATFGACQHPGGGMLYCASWPG
jgi:hypothetical protein